MIQNEKQIGYLDSFCADTEVVTKVINRLIFDLEQVGYPEDEIYEIVLSMDESITNPSGDAERNSHASSTRTQKGT